MPDSAARACVVSAPCVEICCVLVGCPYTIESFIDPSVIILPDTRCELQSAEIVVIKAVDQTEWCLDNF